MLCKCELAVYLLSHITVRQMPSQDVTARYAISQYKDAHLAKPNICFEL